MAQHTLRMPFNPTELSYTLDVASGVLTLPGGVGGAGALVPLAQPAAPPDADNTLSARAARAPGYTLSLHARVDAGGDGSVNLMTRQDIYTPLRTLLVALWATHPGAELVRLALSADVDPDPADALLCMGLATPCPHPSAPLLLHRAAYFQTLCDYTPHWLAPALDSTRFPLLHTWTGGARHPLRAPKPPGGAALYERYIPRLGLSFGLRALDCAADEDIALFHAWQNNPRVAAAWQESGTLAEHTAYLAAQAADAHTLPVVGTLGGVPFLYAELYWAAEDRLGPYLNSGEDSAYVRGMHVLVGSETHRGPHIVRAWLPSLIHALFLADARTQQIVMEPRASNTKILAYLTAVGGFVAARTVDLPHKRAALCTLDREAFFRRFGAEWDGFEFEARA